MIAIGRKNYLFAGSDAGGRRAAALYSLIETAKLNRLDPQNADVLARIADHPARQIANPGTRLIVSGYPSQDRHGLRMRRRRSYDRIDRGLTIPV